MHHYAYSLLNVLNSIAQKLRITIHIQLFVLIMTNFVKCSNESSQQAQTDIQILNSLIVVTGIIHKVIEII